MRICVSAVCCIIGLVIFWLTACGSNNANNDSQGTSSCSRLNGTWSGQEVDQSGQNLGPARLVVRDSQVELEVSGNGAAPECYMMTASCNTSVDPNQMTGTITSSNQSGVAGLTYYGIWEVDLVTHTGRCSLMKPGTGNSSPTTFVASADQRLFVFDGADGGSFPWTCGTFGGGASGDGASGGGGQTGTGLVAKAITAETYTTCALLTDGTLRCWGRNQFGQLGDGTTTDSGVPVTVSGITNAVSASTSGRSTCAVVDGGGVQCWGDLPGATGQCKDGPALSQCSPIPVVMSGVANATAISVRGGFCALLGDGSVQWSFGLGKSTIEPEMVAGITNAVAVSGGTRVVVGGGCALLKDGTIECWGANSSGMGNGTTTDPSTPVPVTGINNATAIAAGTGHYCAVLSDGTVRCWGTNGWGELGDGTTTDNYVPVAVTGINNATAIAVGLDHSCAVLGDGTVWCWGSNAIGALGGNTTSTCQPLGPPAHECSQTPVQVGGIANATAVAAGTHYSCALLTSGKVLCWGRGDEGQLGNGSKVTSYVPVTVVGF